MFFPRLKHLRLEAGLRQEDVAYLLCCQREVYRRYETGVRDIPVDMLIILAKYYRVCVDYILGLSDVRLPYSTPSYH